MQESGTSMHRYSLCSFYQLTNRPGSVSSAETNGVSRYRLQFVGDSALLFGTANGLVFLPDATQNDLGDEITRR